MPSSLTSANIEGGNPQIVSLEVRGLSVGFNNRPVLNKLTLEFRGPGILLVIGPNGTGKTTFIKVLAGILRKYEGRAEIAGVPPHVASTMGLIGYVPQASVLHLSAIPITTLEAVMMGMSLRGRWPRRVDEEDEERAIRALKEVGVESEYWNMKFSELSGGMKQRVLIARAISGDPPLLLLDEPLSHIDPAGRHSLACLIGSLSEKKTVVMTSHDPVLTMRWTKAILVLGYGIYVYGAPDEVLVEEKLFPIYGHSSIKIGEHVHISDAGCRI